MTKLVRNGRHTRRISNEKHASNINIHRSVKSVPHGVIWQMKLLVFFADEGGTMCHCFCLYRYEVCTGMKFVPVPEKSTKKEG